MDDIDQITTEYGVDVEYIVAYNQSFHENKEVISFKALKDGNNYRYRMGIQLGLASNKDHTVAIEQLFANQSYWNKAQITLGGTGITIKYRHTAKYDYDIGNVKYYYTKSIIQFKKIIDPQHRLYYTTHIDNNTNPPSELNLNLVVYGVDVYINDIPNSVFNPLKTRDR